MDHASKHLTIAAELTERPERAAAHLLAALTHRFISGPRDELQPILVALAETGAQPQLASLVDDPEFSDLRALLEAQGAAPADVQRVLDTLLSRGGPPKPTTPLEQMLGPLVRAAASGEDVDALLERLRAQLQAQHPEKSAAELDRFIEGFRAKLAAFKPSA